MARKEKFRSAIWGNALSELRKAKEILDSNSIASHIDDDKSPYVLTVLESDYERALKVIRDGSEYLHVGAMNYYQKKVDIHDYSLVYAYARKLNILDENLYRDRDKTPQGLKDMLEHIEEIAGCPIIVKVNKNDRAIELVARGNYQMGELAKKKIAFYLYQKHKKLFDNIYLCKDDGELIDRDNTNHADPIYNLLATSFIELGIDNKDKTSLLSSMSGSTSSEIGKKKQKKNIVYKAKSDMRINGKVILSEDKESDDLMYNQRLVEDLNKVVCIMTNYRLKRNSSYYKRSKSLRSAVFTHPEAVGEYEGCFKEYYMLSKDKGHVLHFVTHLPYLEIYDVPEDFGFIKNNKALKSTPTIYDIRQITDNMMVDEGIKELIDKANTLLKK